VTVVTVGQVDANFLSSLHLELVHCLPGLGNIDLIVVLHNFFSPFLPFPERQSRLSGVFVSADLALPFFVEI
jgi:hypothetical protein